MSAATVAALKTLTFGEEVRRLRAVRNAAMARSLEGGDAKAENVRLIDGLIGVYAARGLPFSANDLRPHVPEECASLMGACFGRASTGGVIRQVGGDTSTKRTTHCKGIALWIGTTPPKTNTEEPLS